MATSCSTRRRATCWPVCLQHEIDHLDGVTMVDHLPPLKRAQKLQECEQAIEQGARPGETTTD